CPMPSRGPPIWTSCSSPTTGWPTPMWRRGWGTSPRRRGCARRWPPSPKTSATSVPCSTSAAVLARSRGTSPVSAWTRPESTCPRGWSPTPAGSTRSCVSGWLRRPSCASRTPRSAASWGGGRCSTSLGTCCRACSPRSDVRSYRAGSSCSARTWATATSCARRRTAVCRCRGRRISGSRSRWRRCSWTPGWNRSPSCDCPPTVGCTPRCCSPPACPG
ncbi:MAG: Methyltransferase, partial [uncultured Blastococcus sp.]